MTALCVSTALVVLIPVHGGYSPGNNYLSLPIGQIIKSIKGVGDKTIINISNKISHHNARGFQLIKVGEMKRVRASQVGYDTGIKLLVMSSTAPISTTQSPHSAQRHLNT